jgi:serine/threonine protein kinase
MDQSQSPVKEGDVLAGKYKIERVLGVGGMGVVVAAHHIALDQHVAIKFLLPEALAVPDVVARFGREARAAAKIQSEHVARVIDVGTLDSGSPYMVMEYLDGQDLHALLDDSGPLSIEKTVTHVLQACEAIAAAHALGIVHRDLKPANLFLAKRQDRQHIIKVLDFGISKTREKEGDAQITKTSAMMGSPMYMSPEQMKATKSVDVRTDIWALGVILYELVTNDRPFPGETVAEVIANVLSEPPRPIQEIRPDVPAEYARIVHKCLEKRPENRYPTVAAFAEALATFAPVTQRMSIERIHRVLGTQMHIQMPAMEGVAQVPTLAGPGPAPVPAGASLPRTVPDAVAPETVELGTKRSEGLERAPKTSQTAGASTGAAATGATWSDSLATGQPAKPFWQKPSVAAAAIIVVMAGVGVAAMMAMGRGPTAGGTTAATTTQALAGQPLPPAAATATDTPAATNAAPLVTTTVAAPTTTTTKPPTGPAGKASGMATATAAAPAVTVTATVAATTAAPATTTPPAQTAPPPATTTNTNPLTIPTIH